MEHILNKENIIEMFSKAREELSKLKVIEEPVVITPVLAYKIAKDKVGKDEHYKIENGELYWLNNNPLSAMYGIPTGWIKLLEDKPLKYKGKT